MAILVIVLTSPLWVPLLCGAMTVVASIFTAIIVCYFACLAVVLCLVLGGIGVFFIGIAMLFTPAFAQGILMAGGGLILLALGMLTIYPSTYLTKGIFGAVKYLYRKVKQIFVSKREVRNEA